MRLHLQLLSSLLTYVLGLTLMHLHPETSHARALVTRETPRPLCRPAVLCALYALQGTRCARCDAHAVRRLLPPDPPPPPPPPPSPPLQPPTYPCTCCLPRWCLRFGLPTTT